MTVILRRTQPHSAGTMSSMTMERQNPLRMPNGIEHVETSPEQFCVIVIGSHRDRTDLRPPAWLYPIFSLFFGKVLPIEVAGEGCVRTPFISPDVGKFGLFDNR